MEHLWTLVPLYARRRGYGSGSPLLLQAAKAGNLAYVKALLLQGQDPNELDSSGQYTPIMAAAFLGHIEVTLCGFCRCLGDLVGLRAW